MARREARPPAPREVRLTPLHEQCVNCGERLWVAYHAKTALKKLVRGVRPIERSLDGQEEEQAEAMQGYCLAVRSALTDDGRPPLCASGLKLHDRLTQISDSLARVEEKRGNFPLH